MTFTNEDTAKRFTKRNLPKHWLRGAVNLTENDYKQIEENGWEITTLSFPRKFPLDRLDVEVLQYSEEPLIFGTRG